MELYELSKLEFENLARWHPEFRVWIARHALSYVMDAKAPVEGKSAKGVQRGRQDSVVRVELAKGYPLEKDETAKDGARGVDQLSGIFKRAVGDISSMAKRRKDMQKQETEDKAVASAIAAASAMAMVEHGSEDTG